MILHSLYKLKSFSNFLKKKNMVENFESSHEIKEDRLKNLDSPYYTHSARGILVLAEYHLPY